MEEPAAAALAALDVPAAVWYAIIRSATGCDTGLRPVRYQVKTMLDVSSVCRSAHSAGVLLGRELVDNMERELCHALWSEASPQTDATPRLLEGRVPGVVKALIASTARKVMREQDARKMYYLTSRDLEGCDCDVRMSTPGDEIGLSRAGAARKVHLGKFYLVDQIKEACYEKFKTIDALKRHASCRNAADVRTQRLRCAKKMLRNQLQSAMGPRVYAAYSEGRLAGSTLCESARRAETACLAAVAAMPTGGEHGDDDGGPPEESGKEDDVHSSELRVPVHMDAMNQPQVLIGACAYEEIRARASEIDARMVHFEDMARSLQVFMRCSVVQDDLKKIACKYACNDRGKELKHLQAVSEVLRSIFVDFGDVMCLGTEDWACIRALMCAPSTEGTLVEYAQRSLEERQSIRMQMLNEIESWGVFQTTDQALKSECVSATLRMDDGCYSMSYESPLFEDDMFEVMCNLRNDLAAGVH